MDGVTPAAYVYSLFGPVNEMGDDWPVAFMVAENSTRSVGLG